MGESNTVVSAYAMYRHLQQCCFHPSIWSNCAPILYGQVVQEPASKQGYTVCPYNIIGKEAFSNNNNNTSNGFFSNQVFFVSCCHVVAITFDFHKVAELTAVKRLESTEFCSSESYTSFNI